VSEKRNQSFEWKIAGDTFPDKSAGNAGGTLRLGVLLSGSGSNLQALIDAAENGELPGVEIALVVSNIAGAYGLQRALQHKLPAIYLPWQKRPAGIPINMSESEERLTALLQLFQVDLIVLAGWMRIFSGAFLEQFPERVINIHPALLPPRGTGNIYITKNGSQIPVFRGMHAVKQALDAGVKVTGSCVHYVTAEVDAGPVICREEVAIQEGDTEESLHERLKVVEHRLIVEAIRKYISR